MALYFLSSLTKGEVFYGLFAKGEKYPGDEKYFLFAPKYLITTCLDTFSVVPYYINWSRLLVNTVFYLIYRAKFV